MPRRSVSPTQIEAGLAAFRDALNRRLIEKGDHAFISRHEILGVIEEEKYELVGAVAHGSGLDVEEEAMDVVVAAFWGYISQHNDLVEW